MAMFNQVLQEIEQLSIEEQEYLLEVVKKRKDLLDKSKEIEQAYNRGEVYGGTAEELMDFLNL